jgi:hypothetical protein
MWCKKSERKIQRERDFCSLVERDPLFLLGFDPQRAREREKDPVPQLLNGRAGIRQDPLSAGVDRNSKPIPLIHACASLFLRNYPIARNGDFSAPISKGFEVWQGQTARCYSETILNSLLPG